MMKYSNLLVGCVLTLTVGCTNKGQTAGGVGNDSLVVDSLSVEVCDTTPMPHFLYYFDPDHMQVVYWSDARKPDKAYYQENDLMDYYDAALNEWQEVDDYRRNAAGYTQMLVGDNKSVTIRCTGEQLKNPDGEEMYPGELHSRSMIPAPGMKYALADIKDSLRDHHYGRLYIIVHKDYMKTRKLLTRTHVSSEGKVKPLPVAVIRQLEQQYGMKTQRSELAYSIGERYSYGVLQFKPKDKKVIALEVVTDGDNVYSYPVAGHYDEHDHYSTWNADDDGTYSSSTIGAAFEGPEGLELTYEHRAPESATVGLFCIRDSLLERMEYTCYHQMVDEQRPLWKSDIATLRKLYLNDDPHENKNYKLTKYRWIDIDGDMNEELWMRDDDNIHGAFFSVVDNRIRLIGVETSRLHASFIQPRDGIGRLRIAGSAGGPSMFTQIYEIRKSWPVHRFTALEVYGELDECTFDDKPFSKEQAREYLKKLPKTIEPFLYWAEINE